jgi:transcriptional regulator with XRE-family HTH domain
VSTPTIHDRLKLAARGQSYREIAERTTTHPETVRRYMQGQTPSVEFVVAVCRVYAVNGEWLLSGHGPMSRDDIRRHALREANATDLLSAMGESLDRVADRLDRLERFVHTLEARVRGGDALDAGGGVGVERPSANAAPGAPGTLVEPKDLADEPEQAPIGRLPIVGSVTGPDAAVVGRARRVGQAVARRSRPSDR